MAIMKRKKESKENRIIHLSVFIFYRTMFAAVAESVESVSL